MRMTKNISKGGVLNGRSNVVAQENFPCVMLLSSLSVNLNHLKSGTLMFERQ